MRPRMLSARFEVIYLHYKHKTDIVTQRILVMKYLYHIKTGNWCNQYVCHFWSGALDDQDFLIHNKMQSKP